MLVGRRVARREISALLDLAVVGGPGGALVLRGESGIGKTALLRDASSSAGGRQVLTGQGHDFRRQLAFGTLAELLAPVASGEGQLLAALPCSQRAALESALQMGPPVDHDRFAVPAALCSLLGALVDHRGVVVAVDDWNQVDAASRDALLFAVARLAGRPVAVLVAVTDPDPWADPVAPGVERWPTLLVRGLGEEETGELVERSSGVRPPEPVVAALAGATGGNPLAVREILPQLTGEQLRGVMPLPRQLRGGRTPERIYGPRLAALTDAARRALLVLAMAGDDEPGAVRAAMHALGVPAHAVDELEEAGLVRIGADGVRPVHPLLNLAVAATFPPARHRAVHRALAEAMLDPRLVVQRSWHLAEAAVGPCEEAALAMEAAARASEATNGHAAAAAALERAAALGSGGPRRSERLLAAGELMRRAGDRAEAVRLLSAATDHEGAPELVASADHARGRIELFAARPAEAGRLMQGAAALLVERDPVAASTALAEAAVAEFLSGRRTAATRTAARAIELGGDRDATYAAEIIIGTTLLQAGEVGPALARLEALPPPSTITTTEYAVLGGLVLVWIGRPADAAASLVTVERQLRRADALGLLPLALYASAYAHLAMGQVRAATPLLQEAYELASATGDVFWRYIAIGGRSLVEAVAGNTAGCLRAAEEADALHEQADLSYPRDARISRGLIALAGGDTDVAIGLLHPSRSPSALPDGQLLDWMNGPDLAEAYARQGTTVPGDLLRRLEDLADDRGNPAFSAAANRSVALLRPEEADERYPCAVWLYDKAELPLDGARTRMLHGCHLRRHGSRVEAREQLHEARATLERLGAHLWAARAGEELNAAGARVATAVPVGRGSLTRHEEQVAAFVARGATNREAAAALFISQKTVEMHLSRVYRKLGIRSRTELARTFLSLEP